MQAGSRFSFSCAALLSLPAITNKSSNSSDESLCEDDVTGVLLFCFCCAGLSTGAQTMLLHWAWGREQRGPSDHWGSVSHPLVKVSGSFFFFNCISPVLSKYCNMFYSASCRVLSSIFLFLVIFLSFLSVMAKTGSIINKFNIIRFSNNLANSLIWLQHWRVFDRIS